MLAFYFKLWMLYRATMRQYRVQVCIEAKLFYAQAAEFVLTLQDCTS